MKKILLIEDNADVRDNTAEILSLSNYNVLTAKNGKEGVELAQKENPDLIICDIMMPVLDGYGVLHLLSKNTETAGIPFIFLTAKAERDEIRKGMNMGADDYLTKPFDDIDLLSAIESRLKRVELIKSEVSEGIEGLNQFLSSVKGLDNLKQLSEANEIRNCKKKETIYTEGNNPRWLFYMIKGKVKTFRTNEFGKELITGLYKEGDFFGYLPLLEEDKYSDTAEATENSEICMIPKDDFFSLIYKNADVSRKFIKMLSDNLKEKEIELINIAYNSVRKRVAEAIIKVHNHYKKENVPGTVITFSRENLANLTGTATETIIRTLSDFKEEGLIDMTRHSVTVLNVDKLQKMRN